MKQRTLLGTRCPGARSQILLILCISVQALWILPSSSGEMQTPPPGTPTTGPIFKSTDAGTTWAGINSGVTSQFASSLAADPSSPGVLYAGTDRGVYKTTDGGNHWVAADSFISLFTIRTITIDPVNTSIVYAGGFSFGRSGVLKSTDAGLTWKPSYAGLPNIEGVNRSIIDPLTPSILYVEATTGVFKSTNSGNQWGLALPLPIGGDVVSPTDLKIDPLNPSILYAVGLDRIFRSSNSGGNWVDITGQVIRPDKILVDPIIPSVVYVTTDVESIYKSIDGGTTWVLLTTRASFPGTGVSKLAIDPMTSSTLYALTLSGISKSIDGGTTWSSMGTLSSFQIQDLVFDPANPSIMYAGTSGGVRPTDMPWIHRFHIDGKKLFVNGFAFDDGAVLLLDGQEQQTKNYELNPTFTLLAKKAGKKLKKHPGLRIQVRNSNGRLSQETTIWPPLD